MRIIRIMVAFAALTCFGASAQANTALSGIPVLGEIANSGLLGGDILGGDVGLLPNLDVALGAVNNLLDPNNLHLDSLVSNVLVNSLQGNFPRLTTDVLVVHRPIRHGKNRRYSRYDKSRLSPRGSAICT